MVYAKIVGDVITHYPSSIKYLVDQGVLDTETPTDEQLAAANVVVVNREVSIKPLDDFDYEFKPVQRTDGTWWEEWVRVEAVDAALQRNKDSHARIIVQMRNALLTYSDWTQMPDAPLANKDAWRVYRQALRDVPSQEGFPFNVQWPAAPSRESGSNLPPG
jgi:hypothetical protein